MSDVKGKSLYSEAFSKIRADKVAFLCLIIVVVYSILALLVAIGVLGADWSESLEGVSAYTAPSSQAIFGTDFLSRSVFKKTIYGIYVAMSVGFISILISVPIGVTLGALAGYFGGIVDEIIVWFYTVFSSIPTIIMLIALSFIFGKGLGAIWLSLGLTSWVGLCRLIRGEVIKHKNRDYVQAVTALGGSHYRKLFIHILPNVFHLVIIRASLQFQVAIKSEVILSYLGLGVQEVPSWGKMIDDAKQELMQGHWWQLAAATLAMFIVVLAFNILGDALRDALDPKLKGKGS